MKLLVTGGLGFIGSNFILKLLKESDGFEIVNVDAELYGADKRNLSEIEILTLDSKHANNLPAQLSENNYKTIILIIILLIYIFFS